MLFVAALLVLFGTSAPAAAQVVCDRSYTAVAGGGRQYLVDSTRINPSNVCGFAGPIPGVGGQIRIDNVQQVGARTLTYPDGTVVERDASGGLWITPGPGASGTMLIFGAPMGAAGTVRASEAAGASGVVQLVVSATTVTNPGYYRVRVELRPPQVTAPGLSATAAPLALVAGEIGELEQRFANPNAFELRIDQLSVASGAVRLDAVTRSGCGTGATVSGGALRIEGLRVPAGASCTIAARVVAVAAGSGTLSPGAPSGTAHGLTVAGTAPAAIGFQVRAAEPPVASVTLAPARVPPGVATRVGVSLLNPNAGASLSGVTTRIVLPQALAVSNLANACGGDFVADGGVLVLAGGALAAGAGCTLGFDATASAPGDYPVSGGAPGSVESGGGATGPTAVLAVRAVPVVEAVEPGGGSTAGGTAVVIAGSGFDGVTAVRFGDAPAANWVRESSGRIVATSPAGSGTVRVRVESEGGASAASGAGEFTYHAPPAAPRIDSPAAGSVLADAQPPFRGTAEPGVRVTLSIDGAHAGSADAAADGGWSMVPARLSPGEHMAQAEAARQGVVGPPSPPLRFVLAPPIAASVAVPMVDARIDAPLAAVTPVSATGGAGPLRFVLGASVPAGLIFSPTGELSGTPQASLASTRFSVTVTDTIGQTASAAFELAVARASQTIVFTSTPPGEARVGDRPYAAVARASSGLSVALSVGAESVGVCRWTDATIRLEGAGTCVVLADQPGDARWAPAPRVEQRFTVSPPVLQILSTAPPQTQVGVTMAQANAVTGGVSPYRFATASGALPPGLTLDPAGQVSGTPLRAGPFSYAVGVTDAMGVRAAGTIVSGVTRLGVQVLAFTSQPPDPAAIGGSYAPAARATSGLLPELRIDSSSAGRCVLDGALVRFLAAGRCALVAEQPGSPDWEPAAPVRQEIVIEPAPLTIGSAPSPVAQVGRAYSQGNSASGGVAPYAFALGGGALAEGLTLDPASGTVTGVPLRAGPFGYSIRASDARGTSASGAALSGMVARGEQTLSFTSVPPVGAQAGGPAYVPAVSATSGLPPTIAIEADTAATCTLVGGEVRFVASGECRLVAEQPGDRDWESAAPVRQSIAVAAPALALASAPVGTAQVGRAFNQANVVSGGSAPYAFAIGSGALPAGVALDPVTGIVAGVPVRAGAFSYAVRVADAGGAAVSGPAIGGTVARGEQRIAFTSAAPSTARAGGPPYVPVASSTSGLAVAFSIDESSSSLCEQINGEVRFVAAGACVLIAAQQGDANWEPAAPARQEIVVEAAALVVVSASVAEARVGRGVTQTNVASGGAAPYGFAIASGALPEGLALDPANGTVAGVPVRAGPFSYRVWATDSSRASAIGSPVSGGVARGGQTIAFTSAPPAAARVGGPGYIPAAVASSGLAPILSIEADSAGSCAFAGGEVRFLAAGNCTLIAAQAGDADWESAPSMRQTFAVSVAALILASSPAGEAQVGRSFAQGNAASGGTAPYRFELTSGELPKGVALDPATGQAAGVPTRAGPFGYAISVTDARGARATGSAVSGTVVRGGQTLAFTSAPPAAARAGGPVYAPVAVATSGLPIALSVGTGSEHVCGISGGEVRYLSAGSCVIFAAQAGDANWEPAPSVRQEIAVGAAALAMASAPAAETQVGRRFTQDNAASGGVAPYRFAVASGALPEGVALDAATGAVTGVPTRAASFGYSVRATDASGTGATGAVVSGTVARGIQTLGFISAAPGAAQVGGPAYVPVAAASSGIAAMISVEAESAATCALWNGEVRFLAPGNCALVAQQTGDADWMPAPSARQSFGVSAAALSVVSTPAGEAKVGRPFAQGNAASGGALPYAYAVASGVLPRGLALNPATGLVAGVPTRAGPFGYVVAVTDPRGMTANGAAVSGTLAQGDQSLVFGSAPPEAARVGGTYRPDVSASSGLVVALSIEPAAAAACALVEHEVRFLARGTCVLLARQRGSADWNAATPAEQRFAVGASALTIVAGQATVERVGTNFHQDQTVAGGMAPFDFTLASGALPEGAILDPVSGTVVGTVRKAGGYRYAVRVRDAAGEEGVTAELVGTIARGAQSVAFTSAVPVARVGGEGGTPAALASSGLAAVIDVDPASVTVCTLSGGALRYLSTGSCVLRAGQPGDADWEAAEPVEQRFAVAGAELTVIAAPAEGVVVAGAYRQANSASGGAAPVRFELASGALPAGTALDSNTGLVAGTPTSAGSFAYSVLARDAAGETASAAPVAGTIAKGDQAIALVLPASMAQTGGGIVLAGTAESGMPVAFEPLTPEICVVSAMMLLPRAAGTCRVRASQPGGADWNAASPVERQIEVREGPSLAALTLSGGVLSPTFDGAVTRYSVVLDPAVQSLSVATVPRDLAATVTIDGVAGPSRTIAVPAGRFTLAILVSSEGESLGYALEIERAAAEQVVQFESAVPADMRAGGGHLVQASASSGLAVTLSVDPASGGSCALEGETLRYLAAGMCIVRAEQAGDAQWRAAAAEQRFSIGASVAAPLAADLQATTDYETILELDLAASLSGGPTGDIVLDAPAHGRAVLAGTRVRYTPAAGFQGGDRFGYRATGPGGSASAAVTITVAPPGAPVASDRAGVAVPFESAGAVIDLSGSIRGARTRLALVSLPREGAASVEGEAVRYVPRAGFHGIDGFTFAAEGPGGTSNTAAVTLVVGTPSPPGASDRTGLAVDYESAGTSIDMAVAISGAFTGVEISRAPDHGSASAAGSVVTYRPAADFSGSDGFTYRAIGPGGRSGEARVQLVVGTPTAPGVHPGSGAVVSAVTAARNGAVEIDLAALVSGEFDRVAIITPPRHGTIVLGGRGASGTVARYTPATGFVGTDSFAFVASGRGGSSAPAEVVITVTGSRPALRAKAAAASDNETVSVDLTGDAEEAPFTAAAILDVTPAHAAAAKLFAPAPGQYRLDATISPRFSGSVAVRYTLTNAHGISDPGVVTIRVTARPDPTGDGDVGALSDAQGETVRRFARTQSGNFLRRAEQLHGRGEGASSMGLRLASRDAVAVRPPETRWDLDITERMRGVDAEAFPVAARGGPGALGRVGSIAFWTSGAIDIGTLDPVSGRSKISASSAGLSGGADLRVTEGVSVGLGGGYAREQSVIGGGSARLRGEGGFVAGYASIVPVNGAFLDLMLGRGTLSLATRRSVAEVQAVAQGRREGGYTLGAVSAGIERQAPGLGWSLYGRGEFMNAWLDAYRERGAGRHDLRFDARRLRSITATLGGRVDYRQIFAWGAVTPRLRAEWSHELSDASAQGLDYADILADSLYRLEASGWQREQLNMVLGTRFDLPGGWSFDLETGLRTAAGERAMLLRLMLILTF